MTSIARCAVLLVLASLIGACTTTPLPEPPPTTRTVGSAPDTTRAVVAAELRRLGFVVTLETAVSGRHEAADPAWATCGDALVGERMGDSRRVSWASPGARIAAVEVATAATDAGTTMILSARHAARYIDSFLALPFTRPCRSTGMLEQRLLESAG